MWVLFLAISGMMASRRTWMFPGVEGCSTRSSFNWQPTGSSALRPKAGTTSATTPPSSRPTTAPPRRRLLVAGLASISRRAAPSAENSPSAWTRTSSATLSSQSASTSPKYQGSPPAPECSAVMCPLPPAPACPRSWLSSHSPSSARSAHQRRLRPSKLKRTRSGTRKPWPPCKRRPRKHPISLRTCPTGTRWLTCRPSRFWATIRR